MNYNYYHKEKFLKLIQMTKFIKDFSIAIHKENIPELTKLCQSSENVTTFNSQINSFFNKAFKNDKVNIVKWFMTHEPSLNLKLEDKILFSQLEKNNFKIVKLFVTMALKAAPPPPPPPVSPVAPVGPVSPCGPCVPAMR